ncbi:hypothetical protein ANANG_G00074300 [Anguilla anguilla]|uniref:Uncharacterized protein n=1 Tax=Anguilla anguilla TaxID=7936 RepID=A0A9D3ML39_ANGAN|nr:hypothetical protein ANANG_G00074300 [Anguilla anguilla]
MDNYMKRQMIENDDVFRNTLERIVQKYSRVDGSGMEVCLKSMTCRTEKGILPWDGEVVERQMESLKNIADSTGKSARGQDISADIQQDDSQTCSNSTSVSVETEMGRSSENVSWESGPYGSHLMSNAVSDSSLQGELAQPEEQDEELERTLSSQGTLLLDLYPSMLSQVGEAWRRQKSPTPRSAHEPWRRGLHEGVVGQRADPNLVTDSGSSPEELTLLSHTYAVLSSPTSPVGGTASSPLCLYSTGDSPLPVALPLPPRISPGSTQRTLPLFQRRSPHPSHLKWGSPSRPAPLPQRPPPPDGSPSQPPVPCSVLAQRRRSFAGFQAVRHQIDQQFEELYHRLVCQRKVALPLPSPASPLPSSSSLAALALSPIWMRVRKRDRALEPSAWPEPKRFREGCTCSPGSVRHLRQSWAGCCGSSRPEGAVLPQRRSPGTSRLWGGTFRKDPCSGLSWQLHPNPAASREKGETRTSLPEFQGKSPVRASIFLRDWQRGCSPSSSRRRLLYGLPQ